MKNTVIWLGALAIVACSRAGAEAPLTVSAANININTENNDLAPTAPIRRSIDLQTVIDRYLRADLPRALVGEWEIENIVGDDPSEAFSGASAVGRVTFTSTGEVRMKEGAFAAASLWTEAHRIQGGVDFGSPPREIKWRAVGSKLVQLRWLKDSVEIGLPATRETTFLKVTDMTPTEIVLHGEGRSMNYGLTLVTVLRRVAAAQ